MKFTITSAEINNRYTEPDTSNIRYEDINITITLTSSGDTREFTSERLLLEIMKKLEELT